jgi:predicted amidohydrolase YtcJ/mannose-6-phosphate isomerase-like protein (cupin superfamily)
MAQFHIPIRLRLAAISLLILCACGPSVEPADLVLANAFVYTVDADRSVAEAVAIRDNEIVFVGNDKDVEPYVGPDTDVRDLAGKMVLPGLHDVHLHPLWIAKGDICDLESQPRTLDAYVPFLSGCLNRYQIPEGEWLWADQWNFSTGNQPSERYPTMRAALDAVSTQHPIVLLGNDGHHTAVNSAALARARTPAGEAVGLTAETLQSTFASFRELVGVDELGEPNGYLTESAIDLMDPPSELEMRDFDAIMPEVAKFLAKSGITSLQDAVVEPEYLAFYQRLEERGEMTFRMRAALFKKFPKSQAALEMLPETVEEFKAIRERYADSRFIHADGVKIFVDGVIEGNPLASPPTLPNAAVISSYRQPIFAIDSNTMRTDVWGYVDLESDVCLEYRSHPLAYANAEAKSRFKSGNGYFPQQCEQNYGVLEHSEEFIHAFVREMEAAEFAVHAHAVGDRAVRVTIDAFEASRAANGEPLHAQSMAHAQLVHPNDQQRIADLGIFMAFTYAWIGADTEYDMSVIPFIDEVASVDDLYNLDHYAIQNTYPAGSIQELGGILVAGSDAPVDTRDPRPFVNIQQAVTRNSEIGTFNANQRIDIHDAIAAYTINGAKLFGHDARLGSIEVGKKADLIAIDRNLIKLAETDRANEIGNTRVTLTIFDGKVIHEATYSTGAGDRGFEKEADNRKLRAFEIADLIGERDASGEAWIEFLRVPALSMGVYALTTGADDLQTPHTEDEVYYVVSGRGVLRVEDLDRPVQVGSIVYVEANASHRFHSITEDLTTLVFFAPAES